VKLTDKGLTIEQPTKKDDDENDSSRSLLAGTAFGPQAKPQTQAQKVQAVIPAGYHPSELAQRVDPNTAAMTPVLANWLATTSLAPEFAQRHRMTVEQATRQLLDQQQGRAGLVDEFGQRL